MRHDARDCHREEWAAQAEKERGVIKSRQRSICKAPEL